MTDIYLLKNSYWLCILLNTVNLWQIHLKRCTSKAFHTFWS